ncbi:DODA-type extradiol aromatic ring-opening family dioxygenase [Phytohabitans kaempferiae]|uniref:Extradiol ring-cleavage dioxygenase class III enzyme subunit B domain-containing protein n=1 Tax=Phytohabitans kaempferiae TaxID=1620943 RepID=A0ABV6M4C3_9ACTN
MAEIVLGVAAAHTPQLSTGTEMWEDFANRDRKNPNLIGVDGQFHTYDELLAVAPTGIEAQLTDEVWAAKHEECQRHIQTLTDLLAKTAPDVVVVIGDDQHELFHDDGVPAFACYDGPELFDRPRTQQELDELAPCLRAAAWAQHADTLQRYPVDVEFSRHVLTALTLDDFDVMRFTRQHPDRPLGHAFTFIRYRLGVPETTPMVPLFVNTYFPPNVPSARRCHDIGRSLAAAIRDWPGDQKVAVIATGGLSHFVVDEVLDRGVLDAIVKNDTEHLCSISREHLRSGNSEILNWIALAGALESLTPTVLGYVPGYRSPAATGAGMGFMYWN